MPSQVYQFCLFHYLLQLQPQHRSRHRLSFYQVSCLTQYILGFDGQIIDKLIQISVFKNMESVGNFKAQIQAMFEKSFKQLSQKNNMNRTILSNLMDAATEQAHKIQQLDKNIENLKRNASNEIYQVKSEVEKQQHLIHDNFDKVMHRLANIEQGINNGRKNIEQQAKANLEAQNSLNQVLSQLQKIQREQKIQQYYGNKDELLKEINELQKVIMQENAETNQMGHNFQVYNKTVIQPFNTLQVKLALHNKNNEDILKQKMKVFHDRIKNIEKKVQQSKWMIGNQVNKWKEAQRQMGEEVQAVQQEMIQIRKNIQISDGRRKQSIQNNALKLDNVIEAMLLQARQLETRVDILRKGFSEDIQKGQNTDY